MSGTSAAWTPERRAAQSAFLKARHADPAFAAAARKGRTAWTAERRAARSAEMTKLNADPAFRAARQRGVAGRLPGAVTVLPHTHPLVRGLFAAMQQEMASMRDVAKRGGFTKTTLGSWRNRRMPMVDLLDAALNTLDLELAIVPIGSRDQNGFTSKKSRLQQE